jgi:hypothetical protein
MTALVSEGFTQSHDISHILDRFFTDKSNFNHIVSGICTITGQLDSTCAVYYISQDKKKQNQFCMYVYYIPVLVINSLKIMF